MRERKFKIEHKLFEVFLAFSAISLFISVYLIKSKYYPFHTNLYNYFDNDTAQVLKKVSLLGYFIIPLVCILIVLFLIKMLEKDSFKKDEIIAIKNEGNNLLPNYLGYFFVALSIPNNDFFTLSVIFIILFLFVFCSQVNYFNPLLLLFGYKFYYVTTNKGATYFLISKKEFKEPPKEMLKTYRVNNFTFIDNQKETM